MSKAVLRPMMRISEMVPYLKDKNINLILFSKKSQKNIKKQ